jgi:hypothetical protein
MQAALQTKQFIEKRPALIAVQLNESTLGPLVLFSSALMYLCALLVLRYFTRSATNLQDSSKGVLEAGKEAQHTPVGPVLHHLQAVPAEHMYICLRSIVV